MSALICPVIVGRDKEIATLTEALRGARDGRGGVWFVFGEAGIGKTRLVNEMRSRAETLGIRVVQGRAVEGGEQVPFRPLAEVFQAAFRSTDSLPSELAPFGRVLGRLVPQWSEDRQLGETNPVQLFEAIVRLLGSLAGGNGALVVLEDLHWADAETLSAVEYLADQLAATRTACLITVRSDEPSGVVSKLVRIAARHPQSRFTIDRLDRADVEEMARHTLGEISAFRELAPVVTERSEGVPLLVEELLSAYSAEPTPTTPFELRAFPSSYALVIDERLSLLDAREREVIAAAAALGSDLRVEVLRAATGLEEKEVLNALRSGVGANLLVENVVGGSSALVFRHSMVGDAVLAQLLLNERQALFGRVADAAQELFPGLPGDWCNRVAELRLKAGDDEEAARLLVELGRRTLKRGALLTAEQALERARLLVEGDRWKTAGVDRVLVRVLSLLSNSRRLNQLADSAILFMEERPDLLGTPERQGDVLLQIARGMASSGDWLEAKERMSVLTDLAERSSSEEFRNAVRSFRARVALELDEPEQAEAESTATLVDAERIGASDIVCESMLVKAGAALARSDVDLAEDLLRQARLFAERRDLTLWRVEALLDLSAIDEIRTGSLANIEVARELAAKTESPQAEARVHLQGARLHLARFELELADETVHSAADICRRFDLPLLGEALTVEALCAAIRGDARHVRVLTTQARAVDGSPAVEIGLLEATVVSKLARGDFDGTLEELFRAAELVTAHRLQRLRWLTGLQGLMRAAREDDYHPGSENRTDPYSHFARAIHLGRKGEAGTSEEIFRAADRELEPFPWRRNVSRSFVGEAALRDGWGRPAEWLSEAATFFDAAGHAGLASSVRGILRRAGVVVPRRGRGASAVPQHLAAAGITSREMEILQLVGEGMSNNEIAQRLFISVRTVESHVGSAMRKTGVNTRAQLIALLLAERAATL